MQVTEFHQLQPKDRVFWWDASKQKVQVGYVVALHTDINCVEIERLPTTSLYSKAWFYAWESDKLFFTRGSCSQTQMNFVNKLEKLLKNRKLNQEEAANLSNQIRTSVQQGYQLSPKEEELWEKLTERLE